MNAHVSANIPFTLFCRAAGGAASGLSSSTDFSLAYERHERVGKISAAAVSGKTLIPGMFLLPNRRFITELCMGSCVRYGVEFLSRGVIYRVVNL